MKKLALLALITAVGVAGSAALPVQAANVKSFSCDTGKERVYVVAGGQVCSLDEFKEILSGLCNKLPSAPDVSIPDNDTTIPDTNQPETDTTAPDINQPETDTSQPDIDNNAPETGVLTYAEQVVELVNAERAKAGLHALTLDTEIASAALVRAKETEISFSHTRPDGRRFSTVLSDNGISFRGAGENIAWGQRTPEEVMNSWMNSEGHRANILNPNYTKIGVGFYQNFSGRNYWTQLFTY